MKKKLTLWIIFLPIALLAQQSPDSSSPRHHKKKTLYVNPNTPLPPLPQETKPDLSKESLFKALFIAGMNLAQIDGDQEAGYYKYGAHVGVGTVVKFHKNFSASLEILYSMKGSQPHESELFSGRKNGYDITTDYVDIPFSINVHDKKVVMFGVGMQLGVLARYKQTDTAGVNTSAYPDPHGQQPSKIDLSFQTCATFFIKQRIGIGVRFSYSVLKIRDSVEGSRLRGEYHNVFSLRISYLLDPKNAGWKKKWFVSLPFTI